jgi:hypothetical protein
LTTYSTSGNVIFAIFRCNVRQRMGAAPRSAFQSRLSAGQINAMGLLDEILHMVVGQYRQQKHPSVMQDALDWLHGMLGQQAVDSALRQFAAEFPSQAVYRREINLDEYLEGKTGDVPNREILLEEMLLLWVANTNPAMRRSSGCSTTPAWIKLHLAEGSSPACTLSSKPNPFAPTAKPDRYAAGGDCRAPFDRANRIYRIGGVSY